MNTDETQIIGKKVKDMYGTFIGKVIGTITDIDGSIQTVGIDCVSEGLRQIPYEQLVIQGEVVIFIPKWRLESQRLLREKGLTLRRIKALMDIVSENDDMKDDAEIIHEKYRSKLENLDEFERRIKERLEQRLVELVEQMKSVKMLIFDAKMQYKSNEIPESTFDLVKEHTTDLIEHITHETSEISNIQRRICDLSMEVEVATEIPQQRLQEEAVSYLNKEKESEVKAKLPEAPIHENQTGQPSHEEHSTVPLQRSPVSMPEVGSGNLSENTDTAKKEDNPPQVAASSSTPMHQMNKPDDATKEEKADEADWLARMEAQ